METKTIIVGMLSNFVWFLSVICSVATVVLVMTDNNNWYLALACAITFFSLALCGTIYTLVSFEDDARKHRDWMRRQ